MGKYGSNMAVFRVIEQFLKETFKSEWAEDI